MKRFSWRDSSAGQTRGRWLSSVLIVIGLAAQWLTSSGLFGGDEDLRLKAAAVGVPEKPQEIRLRGCIVCLPEEMHRLHQAQIPTPHEHLYGFRTTDGIYYTLLRTRTSEAFFVDKRLHERELIIQGRVLPKTQLLDAIPVGSVHNGKAYDLYYWCTVCAIRTPIPGICMCCQDPVEFVEKPLSEVSSIP